VNKHHKHKRGKKYLRKKAVAERYGCTDRQVDRMAAEGRIPKPFYLTRFPLWSEEELEVLERNEREGMSRRKTEAVT
jgi:predicted DNA-binding transcriptional regulator AlpA